MATDIEQGGGEVEPKRRGGPGEFFREVRAEARKVTWATRQEVMVSTVMVLMMVVMAAVFFFVVDFAVGNLVKLILGLSAPK